MRDPVNAAQVRSDAVFWTAGVDRPFLCYDFVSARVVLSRYTVRTAPDVFNSLEYHAKSWDVEVSDDGIAWQLADRRTGVYLMRGFARAESFDVATQRAGRYVRITMTEETFGDDPNMALSAFELFGTISGFPPVQHE